MPICNIVDDRSNKYNVVCSVIFQHSCHDNRRSEATQFKEKDNILYLGIQETTIVDAIAYIKQDYPDPEITMFLYDPNLNYYNYLTIFQDDDKRYYLVEKKI